MDEKELVGLPSGVIPISNCSNGLNTSRSYSLSEESSEVPFLDCRRRRPRRSMSGMLLVGRWVVEKRLYNGVVVGGTELLWACMLV